MTINPNSGEDPPAHVKKILEERKGEELMDPAKDAIDRSRGHAEENGDQKI